MSPPSQQTSALACSFLCCGPVCCCSVLGFWFRRSGGCGRAEDGDCAGAAGFEQVVDQLGGAGRPAQLAYCGVYLPWPGLVRGFDDELLGGLVDSRSSGQQGVAGDAEPVQDALDGSGQITGRPCRSYFPGQVAAAVAVRAAAAVLNGRVGAGEDRAGRPDVDRDRGDAGGGLDAGGARIPVGAEQGDGAVCRSTSEAAGVVEGLREGTGGDQEPSGPGGGADLGVVSRRERG
jgi:hypothetical protein